MNFENELSQIVNATEGAQSAILIGFDGISVAEFKKPELTLQVPDFMVECGQLLSQAMKMFQGNELGPLGEMVFTSEKTKLIVRVLNSNYFIGLFTKVDGNIGKGRYLLRLKTLEFQSQL